jgi:hypothetical protein
MSGGPVFSGDSGNVCGVVCSSIGGAGETAGYTSFAALMVNTIGLRVTIDTETGDRLRFYELVQRNIRERNVMTRGGFILTRVIDSRGRKYGPDPAGRRACSAGVTVPLRGRIRGAH